MGSAPHRGVPALTARLSGVERVKARQQPRPTVVWSVVTAELAARPVGRAGRILDVGGGTGGFAVPLAEAGHRVTVVDTSPNALAGLMQRATEAGVADSVTAVQGDADALPGLQDCDGVGLVLCHSVLEMVDSPSAAIEAVHEVLEPGGAASILVANRAGAVLSRAAAGNLASATAILTDPAGRSGDRDNLLRRFTPESLSDLVTRGGLVTEQVHGVNVVTDLVTVSESGSEQALREFELATATTAPYRDIATQIHILARKPG
ncbi:methyltransferase family protein [Stackebrandtia endophytica]|uniref:Methyltransferase family protein n=1 Tax=Stackebrandtia endophytica TaxID=1496996 RepID=A0A543B2A2_9ACTN|nr:methyltransferase family protein [Stackebrandtia endophytica]